MGKSFKISGSFISKDIEIGSSSDFCGEIAIDESHLYGVCNATDDPEDNTYYYVSGDVAGSNNKTTSAIFYRFSYGSIRESLKLVVPDLKIPSLSSWSHPNGFSLFQYQGQADVRLGDLPYSYILRYRISELFESVGEDIGDGEELLDALERCRKNVSSIVTG